MSTRNCFSRSYFAYARETLGYIAVFVQSAGLSYLATGLFYFESNIVTVIANAIVSVLVTGVVIIFALLKAMGLDSLLRKLEKIKQ